MLGPRKNIKWTAEEEEAFLAGIAKHGAGKWMDIKKDPQFSDPLRDRTNIHLKDKWRNMNKNRARPIEEKSKIQTLKSASLSIVSNEPSPSSSSDMSNESRYHAMVFEAISTINDENGSDLSGILSFIEERHEVPQNFRKLLSDCLKVLVSQDKLEKVLNRYKISTRKATKPTHTLHPKDPTKPPELPRIAVISTTQEIDAAANKLAERINELAEENNEWYEESQSFREFVSEGLTLLVSQGKLEKALNLYNISELEEKLLEVAPEVVATKLAESYNKSLIAAEAAEEAQRMNKLVEESHIVLQLSLEIHQQCALGEKVILR